MKPYLTYRMVLYVWWPWLTSKRVDRAVFISDSWVSCLFRKLRKKMQITLGCLLTPFTRYAQTCGNSFFCHCSSKNETIIAWHIETRTVLWSALSFFVVAVWGGRSVIFFAYFLLREHGINTKPEKAVKIYATTDINVQDVDK